MFDIIANHRFEIIRSVLTEAAGSAAANSPDTDGIDLWENNQLPNRVWILVDVTDVGTGGVLDLMFRIHRMLLILMLILLLWHKLLQRGFILLMYLILIVIFD